MLKKDELISRIDNKTFWISKIFMYKILPYQAHGGVCYYAIDSFGKIKPSCKTVFNCNIDNFLEKFEIFEEDITYERELQ